ncbi:MAG: diguanylate cyclase [Magnetococcales bacterium]|nr:diguanylate cyclase [Magnetococcales bacterium]
MTAANDLGRQARILVVDDSRSSRKLIQDFLQQQGYSVITAEDGKEAVKRFREEAPDVVLMDANMPVVDGFRACAEIRRCPNGNDTSIIMITGQNDDESVEKAFAAGAEEYIIKPIHWVVLQQRIRLSLNSRYAQRAVAEGHARLEAIVNTAADAIIVINQSGLMESVNLAATKMFGYTRAEVVGRNVAILMPSPYCDKHDQYIERYLQSNHNNKALPIARELVAKRKDGTFFPIELTVSEVKLKDRILFTGILRDTTERKEAEAKIFHQANYDALTGIANRSLFMTTLAYTLDKARQEKQQAALIFVDLDRFKWVNDTLGHAAGDELLRAAAERIQSCLRGIDSVARLGGDEFTVIMPNITAPLAVTTARQILEQLNNHFLLEGKPTYISGSLGVAFFPDDARDLDGLLKCADEAMYRSKKAGRNACHIFSGDFFALKRNY